MQDKHLVKYSLVGWFGTACKRLTVKQQLAVVVIGTSPPSSRTKTSPCSKGDMVPASVLRYGSAHHMGMAVRK